MNEEHLTEGLFYGIEVTDRRGRKLFDENGVSRSYTEVWNKLINVHARQTEVSITDINGIIYPVSPSSYNLTTNAGIGEMRWGIMIGKGSTPVDISDHALVNRIPHGNGLNELVYHDTIVTEPEISGPDCSFTLKRSMTNNSGATVSGIIEMGCYVWLFHSPTVTPNYISALAFRDVLVRSAFVPNGGAITVTYTIKVTA